MEPETETLVDISAEQSAKEETESPAEIIQQYPLRKKRTASSITLQETQFRYKSITAITFNEFVEKLRMLQIEWEDNENFLEAEEISLAIDNQRRTLEQAEVSSMKERHETQSQELEWGHMADFNNFNSTWDSKMEEYEVQAETMRLNLAEKHEDQIDKETERLDKVLPKIGRPTAEWLNLKAIKENMVKVKRYVDAHDINVRMQEIEEREHFKIQEQRAVKIQNGLEKLKKRQKVERETLDKRIEFGKEELKKERALQLDRFIKRYQAAKKECQISQALEKTKLSRRHNEGSGRTKISSAEEQRITSPFQSKMASARQTPNLNK